MTIFCLLLFASPAAAQQGSITFGLSPKFKTADNFSAFNYANSKSVNLPAPGTRWLQHDLNQPVLGTRWLQNSDYLQTKSKKSPGLAFIYSFLVPGMGQLYTNRFDAGKYYMISEAVLWLGFAAFTVYGNWLFNDAVNFAENHAGINSGGKNDDFFSNIGNYDNVDQYNQDMLIQGEYDKVYYPGTGFDFYWDTIENRKKYREDNLASERIHNDRLFIVGAVLINHLVSAVSAIVLTNKYNSEIKKGSGGFSLTAEVVKHFNRIDGLKLKMTRWF